MRWWINALLPSIIWMGFAGLYAHLKKPEGASVLDVRTDASGWLGAGLLVAGLTLHSWSAAVLAVHGSRRGQAATLVVTGPYRFVRNPIYLAGMTLIGGVGLLYEPWHVTDGVMPVALFVYFHLAVISVEEPALRSQFGARYRAYCQRVPRWLPRLARRPW